LVRTEEEKVSLESGAEGADLEHHGCLDFLDDALFLDDGEAVVDEAEDGWTPGGVDAQVGRGERGRAGATPGAVGSQLDEPAVDLIEDKDRAVVADGR